MADNAVGSSHHGSALRAPVPPCFYRSILAHPGGIWVGKRERERPNFSMRRHSMVPQATLPHCSLLMRGFWGITRGG